MDDLDLAEGHIERAAHRDGVREEEDDEEEDRSGDQGVGATATETVGVHGEVQEEEEGAWR